MVQTKDALPRWLANGMRATGLPAPKRVFAVIVPPDFATDDWHRLEGFPRLRLVSLTKARPTLDFHPDQVPRSVDWVELGAINVGPEARKEARPDLTLMKDETQH